MEVEKKEEAKEKKTKETKHMLENRNDAITLSLNDRGMSSKILQIQENPVFQRELILSKEGRVSSSGNTSQSGGVVNLIIQEHMSATLPTISIPKGKTRVTALPFMNTAP
jgi:hypothetical protein